MDLIVVFLLYLFFPQPCVCTVYFPTVTTFACYSSIFFCVIFVCMERRASVSHPGQFYFEIFTRKHETSRNYIMSKSFYQASYRYTQMRCKIFERKTPNICSKTFYPYMYIWDKVT